MGRDQEPGTVVVDVDDPLLAVLVDPSPDASGAGPGVPPDDPGPPADDAALEALLGDPGFVADCRAGLDAHWALLAADLGAQRAAEVSAVRAGLDAAPGEHAAAAVAALPVLPELAADPDALVAAATAARRLEAWAVWQQLQAIAGLLRAWSVTDVPAAAARRARRAWRPGQDVDPALLVRESVVTEVAWAFGIGEQTAADRVTAAELLIVDDRLPQTARLLAEGRLDWAKVRTIVSRTSHLDPAAPAPVEDPAEGAPTTVDLARMVDAEVAPAAVELTVPALRAVLDLTVARVDADAAARAASRARKDRRVGITAGWEGPGTAQLWAIGPADAITAAHEGLDAAARHLRSNGDPRTLDQLRHDLLVTACTTGTLPACTSGGDTDHHNSGTGDHDTSTGDHDTSTGDHDTSTGDHDTSTGDHDTSTGDHDTSTGDHDTSTGDHDTSTGDHHNSGTGDHDTSTTSATDHDTGSGSDPGAAEECFTPPWFATEFPDVGVSITVTIALETLLGLDDDPGLLGDHGPIPAELARDLAATGIWRCVAVDGTHGTVLGVGSSTFTPGYVPGARLRTFLAQAAPRCSTLGCRTRAVRCDIDHRVPHAKGGATCSCNTQPLCRRHHRLKTAGLISASASTDPSHPPGTLVWTSRAGRTRIARPHAPLPGSRAPAGSTRSGSTPTGTRPDTPTGSTQPRHPVDTTGPPGQAPPF